MFTVDQNLTAAKLREKNLVKVFFSMNNHEIATPEMMLEEACSYVMFYGEADGKVSAYIGLYLLQTGRRLFYAHSSNPFSPGETGSVEDEALCFVEGLGALVDEIDIAKLSSEEKSRWVNDQDIFSLKDPRKSPEEPSPEPDEAETVKPEPPAAQPAPSVPAEASQPENPSIQFEPEPSPAQPTPQMQPVLPAPVHQAPQTPSAPQPVPRIQVAPEPAPPAQPVPQMPPAQSAPQPAQAVATAPQVTPAPAEAAQTAPVEEPAPQPADETEVEYEVQAVPPPADVPLTEAAPQSRPASKGTAPGEAAVPAPERTRPKPSAGATSSRSASNTASSTGRQDIRQKTINDDVGKLSKPLVKKGAEDDTGVVRRDREALARLLSSF